jgi:hypothetical protein
MTSPALAAGSHAVEAPLQQILDRSRAGREKYRRHHHYHHGLTLAFGDSSGGADADPNCSSVSPSHSRELFFLSFFQFDGVALSRSGRGTETGR